MYYERKYYHYSPRILIDAVINKTAEELSAYYPDYMLICKHGYDETYGCEALGIACRYCGLETVKVLVEQYGVSFLISERKSETSSYQLSLLKIFSRGEECLKGADFINELDLRKRLRCENGKYRRFLPNKERVNILRYLYQEREHIGFDAESVLYYAYLSCDDIIVSELKKFGVSLSEKMTSVLTTGRGVSGSVGTWSEFCLIISHLDPHKAVHVLKGLFTELSGGKFYYSKVILSIADMFPDDVKLFDFILNIIDNSKINKAQYLRDIIDANALERLSVVADRGWLGYPKRRDEMIEYSAKREKTECTAFLLDFKNRTADLATEQAKAEKKLERELNAAPDSVIALRHLWSYKKREDGTLIITRYKGNQTVVTVPEKIGRNIVTAIDENLFVPRSELVNESSNPCNTVIEVRLPDSINEIRPRAFYHCINLQSVNIPDGVSEIGDYTFANCLKLEKIDLPNSIKLIGDSAFSNCEAMKTFVIPEGVEKIGIPFGGCSALETVELPRSLKEIGSDYMTLKRKSLFNKSPRVNFIVPRDSFAEKYCKSRKASITYKEDDNAERS